jgi:hypothetical protein
MRWWWLVVVVVVVACARPADRRPLSALHDSTVYVRASDGVPPNVAPSVIFAVFTPDCAWFDVDARVTFAGIPIQLPDPGPRPSYTPTGCVGPNNDESLLPAGAFDDRPVELVIADHTETWTIALPGLHDANVAIAPPITAGQAATVTWFDGPRIVDGCFALDAAAGSFSVCMPSASLQPGVDGVAAIEIPADVPAGSARAHVELDGRYTSGTTRCDGPASCILDLSVMTSLDVTVAP